MKNYGKLMQIVSVILLVFSIIYTIGGVLIFLLAVFMLVFAGTDAFVSELFEAMERTSVTPEMLLQAVTEWNGRLGTELSIMEMIRVLFIVLLILGLAMIIYSVVGIVCAAAGFKAAKGTKAQTAFVLGIVLLACTLIRLIVNFGVDVKSIIQGAVSFVLPGLYLYAAKYLMEEAQG